MNNFDIQSYIEEMDRVYDTNSFIFCLHEACEKELGTELFTMRLLFLLYGEFPEPMKQTVTDIQRYMFDPAFVRWLEGFMDVKKDCIAFGNDHQLGIARGFLCLREGDVELFKTYPVVLFCICRMQSLLFFRDKRKEL